MGRSFDKAVEMAACEAEGELCGDVGEVGDDLGLELVWESC